MFSGNPAELIYDRSFPLLTVKQFAANQFNIPEDELVERLYLALNSERQTDENRKLIEKAMTYKVNASSDIILFVNTNEGLQLVHANSQRRKKILTTNGACENGETLAECAYREFIEELGNPAQGGILTSIVSNRNNVRSIKVKNKIGTTLAEMANRIVDLRADKHRLFVNISSLFANAVPVNITNLKNEISDINARMKAASKYYFPAVKLVYGDKDTGVKPSDFSTAEDRNAACKIINAFKENCQDSIPIGFVDAFSLQYDETVSIEKIKSALSFIIDLTENNEINIMPRDELEKLLSLDLSKKEDLEFILQHYFEPSLVSIFIHKGSESPQRFLGNLERLATPVMQMTLGFKSADRDDDYNIKMRSDYGKAISKR